LLREKAKAKMPNIPREPHDFLVAVSNHRKTLETVQPADFMWFKCRAKHTVAKIRTFYTQKTSCQVDLYSGSGIPADTTQIAWLDHWGDKFIVFRAVENEQQAMINASQSPRTPLQPVNGYALSKSSDASEKSTRGIIKPDPDRPPILPPSKLPKSHFDTLDPFGASLRATSLRPDQSKIKSMLQLGQHIGAVVKDPQDYVPPALTSWPSAYGQAPQPRYAPPVSGRPDNSLSGSSSSYVKEEHQRTLHDVPYLSPYQDSSEFSPAPDTLKSEAAPIPNAAQNKRLAKILAEASPEILEAEVQSNITVLDQLKLHLSDLPAQSPEAQQWLQQIETLRKQNINEPTIIGVVGNTGAGTRNVSSLPIACVLVLRLSRKCHGTQAMTRMPNIGQPSNLSSQKIGRRSCKSCLENY
jgi:hypothetical protein